MRAQMGEVEVLLRTFFPRDDVWRAAKEAIALYAAMHASHQRHVLGGRRLFFNTLRHASSKCERLHFLGSLRVAT